LEVTINLSTYKLNKFCLRLLVAYKNMLRAVEDRCISTIYSLLQLSRGKLPVLYVASFKRHDTLARDYLRTAIHFSAAFITANKSLDVPLEYAMLTNNVAAVEADYNVRRLDDQNSSQGNLTAAREFYAKATDHHRALRVFQTTIGETIK
jgi:hypothetical protein